MAVIYDPQVFTQAVGFEQISVAATAVGFTTTQYRNKASGGIDARIALVTLEGTAGTNDIRYTFDGTTPTTSVGHLLPAGQAIVVRGLGNITKFRAIRAGSTSGVISVTYFG